MVINDISVVCEHSVYVPTKSKSVGTILCWMTVTEEDDHLSKPAVA